MKELQQQAERVQIAEGFRWTDTDALVDRLSEIRDSDEFIEAFCQLQDAIKNAPPLPWSHPYDDSDLPVVYWPRELPRTRSAEDTVFRDMLVFFWQHYYPHYRGMLRNMIDGKESISLERHLGYVQGTWFSAFLAYEFLKAHMSKRPHWNGFWLHVQINQLGKPYQVIAQEYCLPRWQVRLAMAWHGLAPASGWRKWLWAIGLYKPRREVPRMNTVVAEQVSSEDGIFVRKIGSKIFIPVGQLWQN